MKLSRPKPLLLVLAVLFVVGNARAESPSADGTLRAVALRTEHAAPPMGVESEAPRLSWRLAPTRAGLRARRQTAYQILVATDSTRLIPREADLWNSGKVASDSSLHIPYAGAPLPSDQRVYWTVREWNGQDWPSAFSAPTWWEMGLLDSSDWTGEWFYKGLLGLRPDGDAVGFDHVLVHPHPVGGLTWAEGHYDSVRGRIESRWTVTGDRFTLSLRVPVSATATVHLPAYDRTDVTERGPRPADADGVSFVESTGNDVVYRVESGRYRFVVDEVIRE